MTDYPKRTKFPFKVVSSSVDTGYHAVLSASFKPGTDIVGHHQDTYGGLEDEPMQSPFAKQFVGGEQHRHTPLNTGNDNDFNRAEAYKILATASSLRVYGPDFENVNKPRAQIWTGAKSPVNITNIQTSGNIAGNFNKNYEIFQTVGRRISNNLIVDGFEASGTLTSQFIAGANNYTLPDIVNNSKSIIVERFNSPGGKQESSRGALDRTGEELSANNSLTTRNIVVRQPLYNQLTQHSAQFGSGSTEGISIHKVNRNGLRRIKISGSVVTFNTNNVSDHFDNIIINGAVYHSRPELNSNVGLSVHKYLDKYHIVMQEDIFSSKVSDPDIVSFANIGSDVYFALNTAVGLETRITGTLVEIGPGGVLKYNTKNKTFSELGSNGPTAGVTSVVVSGTDIYIGGFFTSPGLRVAKYSTTTNTWSALSGGLNDNIFALAVSGTDIYACGNFTSATNATPISAARVAKWSTATNTWSALSGGLSGGSQTVRALVVSGTDIYAGGLFTAATNAAPIAVANVAKWSTTTNIWSALSGGLNDIVRGFAVSGSDIYAGGSFSTTGSCVAKWSTLPGGNWSALSGGLNNVVFALAVSGSNIYAGGTFTAATNATPIAVASVAEWSTATNTWSALSGGLGAPVNQGAHALFVSGTDLYAGGNFTFASRDGTRLRGCAVANTSYSSFYPIVHNETNIYTSLGSSYKAFFNQTASLTLNNGYHNAKLISTTQGLNLFTVGYNDNICSMTDKALHHAWSVDGTTWSTSSIVINSIHPVDEFGEYWDVINENNISGSEKLLFVLGSPAASTGSKDVCGVVSFVSASMFSFTDPSGQTTKYLQYSDKKTIATGSAAFNKMGTGISMISCSSGYQAVFGELLGDTNSTNLGNIWVATSSNGAVWSNPVSIYSGTIVSSSVGFNNIKAASFSNNNISRTYVYFTEPFFSGSTNVQGKFFVISSSINNDWGTTNIRSTTTELHSASLSTTSSNSNYDTTGSNKYSIEVHVNSGAMTYCFGDGTEDATEDKDSSLVVGRTIDGINWESGNQTYLKVNPNTKGCERVAMATYTTPYSDIEFPIFFTDVMSKDANNQPAYNSISAITNNKYAEAGPRYIDTTEYDNFWINRSVPRNDFGYAWITASATSNPYTIGTSSIQFAFTSSLVGDKAIDLDTQTLNSSISGSEQVYSSWRQTRTNDHPVARKLRDNNIIAIENQPLPSTLTDGNQVISKRSGTSINYKETPVTSKFYPIEQNIQFSGEPDGTSTNMTYTYMNNSSRFANEDIEIRLGLSDKNVEFYDKIVRAKNLKDSPIKNIISLKFRENVFPKELNTYLSGTRSRTEYIIDKAGFDRDGYDIQLGTQRVFWRNNQKDRKRSPNNSGGHINSLGYSSLEESGSNFTQNKIGLLSDNNFITLSGTFVQNITGLNEGLNNSILPLESGSTERDLYTYTGSFRGSFFSDTNLGDKVYADIVKRGFTADVAGEFNNSFIDFYEQFIFDNVKQSIGTIYRNTSFKSMLNQLPMSRENLIDAVSMTEDEEVFSNPRPRYVSFIGGGELNTGSVFDNSQNFSTQYRNTYISGANSTVTIILPIGDKVYFGGSFTVIGGVAADYVAQYDKTTQTFSTLGTGGPNNTVNTLVVSGSDIYAGGDFTTPGSRVAKWSTLTNTWSALSGGLSGGGSAVNTLVVSGSDIYAGGSFTSTGSRVAKWSTLTNTWSALSGGLNGTVDTLVVSGSDIYAGGSFTPTAGTGSCVAKWSTATNIWSVLSGGLDSLVNTLVVSGTDLYAGGFFTPTAGTGSCVAKWSTLPGGNWSALSGGLNGLVNTLVVSGTDLYAGGYFTPTAGTGSYVAKWSTLPGGNWSALSGGLNDGIFALAVSGTDIYAGGDFTTTPTAGTGSRVAKWSTLPGGNWSLFNTGDDYSNFNRNLLNNTHAAADISFSTLDNGLQNITSIDSGKQPHRDPSQEFYQTDIYKTTKDFSILPEFRISEHMKYYVSQSGGNFKSKNNVFLSIDGVGGKYRSADTEKVGLDKEFLERYAYTDIFNKETVENDYGNNLNQDNISINIKSSKKLLPYNGFYPQNRTTQLASLYKEYTDEVLDGGTYNINNINDYFDDRIISGGQYLSSHIGDSIVGLSVKKYLDKYHIATQEDLISSNPIINAIVNSGSDVYFGFGSFGFGTLSTRISGSPVSIIGVAKYNIINKTFSTLGTGGPNSTVNTLVVSGSDIYAGGDFTTPGSRVAKWSTATNIWSVLSGGLNNTVNTLVVSGSDIYACGNFTSATNAIPISAARVAKWSTATNTWSALSGGLNGTVNTLVVSGSDIYAGGTFTSATNATPIAVANVAKWSTLPGGNWSALSGGLNSTVNTLVVSGTVLYAGGFFTTTPTAGTGSRVAKWSTLPGGNWSALSGGLNNVVYTLVVSGTDLYAGGSFTTTPTAGTGSRVAKWSTLPGGNWSALSGGLNSTVNTLVVSGTDLYAGGFFTSTTNVGIFLRGFAVANTSYSGFYPIVYNETGIYTSSISSYKDFNQTASLTLNNGYHNAKLISTTQGLNLFTVGYNDSIRSMTDKALHHAWSVDGTTWTTPSIVINSIHAGDEFGEYWDVINENNIPENEKLLFVLGSPAASTGSKDVCGVVSFVSASMFSFTDPSGQTTKYLQYSDKKTIATGSAAFNKMGTGISMISCSSGYQAVFGELLGDTNSTNLGNIWVATSSNGTVWSNPVSIYSGTIVSSSVGFNSIKAASFSNNNISRTYVYFTEPFFSGSTVGISASNVQGKFFVISSSINNDWGTTNIRSKTTELYSALIATTQGGSNFDTTGSNKYSIEVHVNSGAMTYCFGDGTEDATEDKNSSLVIGRTIDGINWESGEQLYLKVNQNTKGCERVAMATYTTPYSDVEFPIFFTDISSSAAYNSISAITNNKYTQFTINISGTEKLVKQAALEPIVAPGILYNTIKSGLAVDWVCATGSQITTEPYGSGTIVNSYYPQSFKMASHKGTNINENMYGDLRSNLDYRIDFEKLINPDDIFIVKNQLTASMIKQTQGSSLSDTDELVKFISGCYIYGGYEPHMSSIDFSDFNQLGPKKFSIPFVYRKEEAKSTGLYSLAMSNFLAETVKFFLQDELLTNFQSLPDSKWKVFEQKKIYYMDIVMEKRKDLVMMEAYHSSKHPTGSNGEKMNGRYFGYPINKTNKKLWSKTSSELFTDNEAKLIHNDPAYAPYTPPYFEGRAIARLSFSPTITRKYTLDEVLAALVVENIFPGVLLGANSNSDAYLNKMPIESSVSIDGKLPWVDTTIGSNAQKSVNNDINSWVIGTKFETPVLNFASQSLVPSENNYCKTSGYGRGMWSGYGTIPTSGQGIYISIEESFPQKLNRRIAGNNTRSLLQNVGFSSADKEKRIGTIAESKLISEAVMVIPFIETISQKPYRKYSYGNRSNITKMEKSLGIEFIGINKVIYKNIVDNKISGSSIFDTVEKMGRFIVPPELDFVKDRSLSPYVAYIGEFTHTLVQQDLADIWQGVAPEISRTAELEDVNISHPNGKNEFYHGKGMPNNIRFMVFKIKQKGEFDYFKVTKDSSDDVEFSYEQKIGKKPKSYSYNWPYDYFSLVELAKIDVQIDYKKKG